MSAVWFAYLDASALAKRYTIEVGTPVMNHLFTKVPPNRLYVLTLGVAEVVSVMVRKRNAGAISAVTFSLALLDLGREIINAPAIHKAVPDEPLVAAAIPLIDQHAINSSDAAVLRSALDAAAERRRQGDDLILVASDRRLVRAAQAEGLVTFNPETQSQADFDTLLGP
jgi:uncharacterized protein